MAAVIGAAETAAPGRVGMLERVVRRAPQQWCTRHDVWSGAPAS
jgi:hypothetical protein